MSAFSFAQMQMHSEKLRAILDSYDSWVLVGTEVLPKYIYRSGAPLISIKNLASTDNLTLTDKVAIIPAAAFGADSVIFIYDSESTVTCATVSGGVKVSVNHGFYTDEFILQGKSLGGTVKLQHGKNNEVENFTLN